MIVDDANVLIAQLDNTDAAHAAAEKLLLSHVDSAFGASPITLAETLVGPTRIGRQAEATAALSELKIELIPFPTDAPGRLATLRSTTSLKLPDCCVLLAAQQGNATGIATFDRQLATRAEDLGIAMVR